jgi:hypothetical protein
MGLGRYSIGTATGLLVATQAAGETLWSARWTEANKRAIIESLKVNGVVTGTITAAVPYDLGLYFANSFTVSPAAGGATLTGRNGALKSSYSPSLFGGIYTHATDAVGQSVMTSIRSASYKWTASAAGGAGAFYCEAAAGGNPTLATPSAVRQNGVDMTLASAVAALPAGSYWYGDSDTLGYNTVVVRLADDADPDGKAAGYVEHWVGAVFTADTQPLIRISGATGTVIGTQFFGSGLIELINADQGEEIELKQNEGLLIKAPLAGPATGTFRVSVNMRWYETT